MFGFLWKSADAKLDPEDMSVAVAESVTAGALCNSLCAEPGASSYFKGGITAYSIASKKEILGIDTTYAEQHNFANPFTTAEMAKAAAKMFKSRFGISTTGYSLPYQRPENKEKNECALDVQVPYAYICLYDALTGEELVVQEYYPYDVSVSKSFQRASAQAKFAIRATELYKNKVRTLSAREI